MLTRCATSWTMSSRMYIASSVCRIWSEVGRSACTRTKYIAVVTTYFEHEHSRAEPSRTEPTLVVEPSVLLLTLPRCHHVPRTPHISSHHFSRGLHRLLTKQKDDLERDIFGGSDSELSEEEGPSRLASLPLSSSSYLHSILGYLRCSKAPETAPTRLSHCTC